MPDLRHVRRAWTQIDQPLTQLPAVRSVDRGTAALRDERQSLSELQGAVGELKLGHPREPLDAGLLAKRGGAISDRNDGC
jgi:hypothetical protein